MKKIILLGIFSLGSGLCILLTACNQREIKDIYIYDQPQLSLKYDEKDTYYKEYPVYLTLNLDKGNGIDSTYTVRHEIKTGKGKLLDENDTLPKEVITQQESLKLQYVPQTLGNHTIVFTLVDSQGQESMVEMQVKGVKEKTIAYPEFTAKVTDAVGDTSRPNTFYYMWQSGYNNYYRNEIIRYTIYLEEKFIADEAVKYELKVENAMSQDAIKGHIKLRYQGHQYARFPATVPLDIKDIRRKKGFFDLHFEYTPLEMKPCDPKYVLQPFNTTQAYNLRISNGKEEQILTQPFNVHLSAIPDRWFTLQFKGYEYRHYNQYMGIYFNIQTSTCFGLHLAGGDKFQIKFEPLNYSDHELTSAVNASCHDLRIKSGETGIINMVQYQNIQNCEYFLWGYPPYGSNKLVLYTKGCNGSNCDLPKVRITVTDKISGISQSFLADRHR
ncbi:MAG: hypothetical protein ACQPRJ_02300 [Solitalea-like symbiont of Acarus siro]